MALPGKIHPRRLAHTHKIHAAMLEEAAVFNGQDRVNHHLGYFVVLYDFALGTIASLKQRSDELGFQFVGHQVPSFAADVLHLSILNLNGGWFGAMVGLGPGTHLDTTADQAKASERRLAISIRVSGAP